MKSNINLTREDVKLLVENLNKLKPIVKGENDLLESMGIDEETYDIWCRGRRIPNALSVIKLAKNLQMDVLDLYTKKLVVAYTYEFEQEIEKWEKGE